MPDTQLAFSLRGLERAYGVSRNRIGQAVRDGELRAQRVGKRRLTILRSDFELWLRGRPVIAQESERDWLLKGARQATQETKAA